MAHIIGKELFDTKKRHAAQDSLYELERTKIPERYNGDIQRFVRFCEETGQTENGRALIDYLEVSMTEQRIKKTTWERRLAAAKKYLFVVHGIDFRTDLFIADRLKGMRARFKQEEYADQIQIVGKSGIDKTELLAMIEKLPIREKAIALINLVTANRPSEMVRMQIKDFDLDGRFVRVYLKKQKVWHNKRLTQESIKAVRDYIKAYKLKHDDYFVGRVYKSDRYESTQIGEVSYNKLIHRILGFAPYTMRKTQVSAMHEAGADLPAIAKQTGHQSLQTIENHYLNVSDATIDKFL